MDNVHILSLHASLLLYYNFFEGAEVLVTPVNQ